MQGSGAHKRSLDGKTNSPHYGGYTTHAVESGDPPHGVIVVVVEYYCILINIIDVAYGVSPWDVSYFAWAKLSFPLRRREHFYKTLLI